MGGENINLNTGRDMADKFKGVPKLMEKVRAAG
jgi:hypothetical protein